MADILVTKLNEVQMRISASPDILHELHDYFSFYAPGYRFSPKFKAGIWNGKIQLFKLGPKTLYLGLLTKLREWAESNNYTVETDFEVQDNEVDLHSLKEFIKSLNLPFVPYEHQLKCLRKAVRKGRLTMLVPTSGGKSLIIYMILRYFDVKSLVIVPTISLVNQMASDFESYGYEEEIHKIMGGREKYSSEQITISTWQSLSKIQDKTLLHAYDLVFVDEVHGAAAKELSTILENMPCALRFGCTGTLDNGQTKANPLTIEGLLGEVYKPTSTRELIDKGLISELKIKALVLNYSEEEKKLCKKMTYQEEIDFLCGSQKRNRFIVNLVKSLEGNTIVLFNYIEKHGRVLEKMFQEMVTDRPIYWVSGSTDAEEREEIRKIVNTETNAILLGSRGAIGTGTDIRNLHNLIFTSPSKAKIQTLQNIGRVLRKSDTKVKATLFDIADDLSWKKRKNHTLGHFLERAKIYDSEQFPYKIYSIGLK